MNQRVVRIGWIGVCFAWLIAGLAAQVWMYWVSAAYPRFMILADLTGLQVESNTANAWEFDYVNRLDWWKLQDVFSAPYVIGGSGVYSVILPWWLIFLFLAVATPPMWRLTRKASGAFPVTPIGPDDKSGILKG